MSEYYKIIEKMYFVDTAFTARHIVSAASSEIGIAGALQRHVLFICRENGGRWQIPIS